MGCTEETGNTGIQGCDNEEGKIIVPIVVPKGAEFADMTVGTLLANWTTKLNLADSLRWLPLPIVQDYEDQDTETNYFTSGYGDKIKIDDGEYGMLFTHYLLSMFNTRELSKLNGRSIEVYFGTENDKIIGTSSDGIKFQPFEARINVEKPKFQSTDSPKSDAVSITLTNPDQRSKRGYNIDAADFSVKDDLVGLIDLKTVTSVPTATGATSTVTEASNSIAITGLVADDFILTNSAGAETTITGATDNGDGTYAVTWSIITAETYTLTLKGQPDMTTKGYDIFESDTFVIA